MTALASRKPEHLADLEGYLFEKVGPHYRETGKLSVEDFWLILIWKANRSKNHSRRALERHGVLGKVVTDIANTLRVSREDERLRYLVLELGLGLATASAILTVIYPDVFTVYDVRACGQLKKQKLGSFQSLGLCRAWPTLWERYRDYVHAVKRSGPAGKTLREKDKYLWGKSLLESVKSELGEPVPTLSPRRSASASRTHSA